MEAFTNTSVWVRGRSYRELCRARKARQSIKKQDLTPEPKLARTHAACDVLCEDFDAFDFTTLSVDAVTLIGALVHVPKDRFPSTLARILQALKPGGHVLLTMEQGEGISTARDGRCPLGVRALGG